MTEPGGATVTILFSDLVSSTELLQRAGDESAQRIFQAHHRLLQDAVAANGGHEVKWLGDGLMVAFPSAADAVRCAIAMQQSAQRPATGERLEVRVGLNVGDALREESDYFGTPVVIAKRLCDEASGGQVLCSSLVAGLLTGRQAFQFRDIGDKVLKGMSEPVAVSEVLYEAVQPGALLRHTPFVGREAEGAKLKEMLQETRAGQGGLVLLVGEPGIGKTRLADEFAESARASEAVVVWGRCFEGEWTPPYGPFAEAIQEYARTAEPDDLREDLGAGAAPIARLVPALRQHVPDIAEPAKLEPDEERYRLLDAVAQFLIAASARSPVVLMLDDLHWADKGSIAMLRHLARFAPRNRLLLLGTYRDVELDRKHPLADSLGALRRETNFERILLKGLDAQEVGTLVSTIAEQDVPEALVTAISAETDGNPFFIREVLLHLVETGALYQKDGEWTSDATSIEELGIPEGVREVIGRRLSRLSDDANGLLTVASAFSGGFRFDVAGQVADLKDVAALDALDEALDAQIIRATPDAESFVFTHALIRQTLYGELSPPRQVRLHRQVAEALEHVYGDEAKERAAELAYQYHRSSTLPGVERGVEYALVAADNAEETYARDEAATFLGMALELLPEEDDRRPALLARYGLALAWTLRFEEALKVVSEAGKLLAEAAGADAAADYLEEGTQTLLQAGHFRGAWTLAGQGLSYIGDRRDGVWARLTSIDLFRRDAEDPDNPGISLQSPERDELREVAERLPFEERPFAASFRHPESREEVLAHASDDPAALTFLAGEYRRAVPLWTELAEQAEREGRIAQAANFLAQLARAQNTLGNFTDAQMTYDRALRLSDRIAGYSIQGAQVQGAKWEMRFALGEGWEDTLAEAEPILRQPGAERQWALAILTAAGALAYAVTGNETEALRLLAVLEAPVERASAGSVNYTALVCLAARILWQLERTDGIEVFERNLRAKVIGPDFHYPLWNGHHAMAQLHALHGRYDEAAEEFANARADLDEKGARPLRAIVDYDEALMYQRRAEPGDEQFVTKWVDAALGQFQELGMTGWIRRAEELSR